MHHPKAHCVSRSSKFPKMATGNPRYTNNHAHPASVIRARGTSCPKMRGAAPRDVFVLCFNGRWRIGFTAVILSVLEQPQGFDLNGNLLEPL